ncbi:MAG: hypothetical protein AB3N28_05385 [Kordiimonas sp.]
MSAILQLPTPASATHRFEKFRACLPLAVAQARRGFGGHITFDFGNEQGRDAITNEPQFDWHLWVYMCDWDLYKGDSRILWRRESDNALAGAILAQLSGERLLDVEHDAEDDCFVFIFSGGYRLNLDPDFYDYDAGDDLFMLFEHNTHECLSYNPKRHFYQAA